MAHTFHAARDERRTSRASREMRLRAAVEISEALNRVVEMRAAQHAAELERSKDRAYVLGLDHCAHASNTGMPVCYYCGANMPDSDALRQQRADCAWAVTR